MHQRLVLSTVQSNIAWAGEVVCKADVLFHTMDECLSDEACLVPDMMGGESVAMITIRWYGS